MNDFDLYASGMMNPDEAEQWDHVSSMMAERGEHDGWGPAQDAYVAMQGDPYGDADEDDFIGPHQPATEIDF
jgi:hypothetical protein